MSNHPPASLELYERSDKKGQYYFKIGIRGILSPHQKSYAEVDADRENLQKTLEATAGALAERQNKILGEIHDPGEVASYVRKMFKDIMQRIQK